MAAEVKQSHEEVLDALEEFQSTQQLSIIKLSEPIITALKDAGRSRSSDVSTDAFDSPSPASLEADLMHYKDLFSKLRFSYVEQVTKEKFLRGIVGEPPLIVEHQENVELEEQLASVKALLKSQKDAVAEMVTELERQGRELAQRYETIQLQMTQLRELPEKIQGLESSIAQLRVAQDAGLNPNLNLPLEKTLNLVQEREREKAELDRELERLQAIVPRKEKELERSRAELQALEVRRLGSMSAAKEAKRRKEASLGGAADDLEERGRWWRGVESSLKGMLEIEG